MIQSGLFKGNNAFEESEKRTNYENFYLLFRHVRTAEDEIPEENSSPLADRHRSMQLMETATT